MGKTRSPNRERALEIYIENSGNITPREIAKILDESASNISSWKNKDRWNEKLPPNKGGAPKGNFNSLKHGLYCGAKKFSKQDFLKKYLPKVKQNIINDIEENELNPIDILWSMILDGYSDLLRSAKIMHVKNSNDITKILKKESYGKNSSSEEYEIETALNKQATALKARALQMQALNNLIHQYDEMIHDSLGLATEEQKLRIDKLRVEVSKLSDNKENGKGNLNKLMEVFNRGPAE